MRRILVLPILALLAAAPAAAQTGALVAETNPYAELFTRWDGANRESLEAEARVPQGEAAPESGSIPASSPLVSRSQVEAAALGERVGAVVRAGDCAEGERIAREAGDFALVRAVRAHCRAPR